MHDKNPQVLLMNIRLAQIILALLLANDATARDLKFGIVGPTSAGNTKLQMIKAGALAAAREKSSGDTKITIESVDVSGPSEGVAALQDMANKKEDGIIVATLDHETVQEAIEIRRANGIPVVLCGGPGPNKEFDGVTGTDNFLCGQRLMEELAKQLANKGLVAIYGGDTEKNEIFSHRVEGAQDKAKSFPGIKILDVFIFPANQVITMMQDVPSAHPNLGGWLMVVDWGLFPAARATRGASSPKIAAVDPDVEDSLKLIESGELQVLLVQDFFGWGWQSVLLLTDKSLVKNPDNNFFPKEVKVVATREEAQNFLKDWNARLGKREQ